MSKKNRSFLCCLTIFFSIFLGSAFGEVVSSAASANHRTAIRYLRLAKQFASEKLWSEADSNARMGLAYDEKIADLWYLRAVSLMSLGEKKSQILPLVVTALNDSEWVDYNRDGARILYADLLCSTREFSQALSVLDSEPFIYSADAEYIRVKSYYSLGDAGNVKKARAKIDSARRVYPADSRFAKLFYTFEYQILRKNQFENSDSEVKALSDAFSLALPLYKNADSDLELYAAIFASGEKTGKGDAKKVRMLKAFNSKGLTSPLYAIEALKTGLLGEDAALDYFYKFSDKSISISVLEDFAALLGSDEAKKEFSEYLNSYNGTIFFDTDGDLSPNMVAVYKRGRPESISYDYNQDDENEWAAVCDFGVPQKLSVSQDALEIEYDSWPYVKSANYKARNLTTTLIAETLAWTPFVIEADSAISQNLQADFYVPSLNFRGDNAVSWRDLLRAALSYSVPSNERAGAVIQVSLLNGVPQVASYSVGEKIYAWLQFENGIPVSRKVDVNGDGLFETTEFYGYSADFAGINRSENYISAADEMQVMTNLFGTPEQGTGFYLKKITVDQNGDTIPDFTEVYLPANLGAKIPGKISSWDLNGDGNWDIQYIKQPSQNDDVVREQAKFHYSLVDSSKFSEELNSSTYEDFIVTVFSENSLPVLVEIQNSSDENSGAKTLAVKKSNQKSHENFYWIFDDSPQNAEVVVSPDFEKFQRSEEKIINAVNQIGEQGVSIIVETTEETGNARFLAVKVEAFIFAMQMSDESTSEIAKGGAETN